MIDKWAYIGAWLAASIAISVTVYVTKNGNYLWFLIIPDTVLNMLAMKDMRNLN